MRRPYFDEIPVSYTRFLPYLIHVEDIVPKEISPSTFPYGPKHNPNVSCEFHVGYIGYSTEDCMVFKVKVQKLLDKKLLSFSEEQPNVKTNPLPGHNWPKVNAIDEEEYTEVVKEVIKVKTSMLIIIKRLK